VWYSIQFGDNQPWNFSEMFQWGWCLKRNAANIFSWLVSVAWKGFQKMSGCTSVGKLQQKLVFCWPVQCMALHSLVDIVDMCMSYGVDINPKTFMKQQSASHLCFQPQECILSTAVKLVWHSLVFTCGTWLMQNFRCLFFSSHKNKTNYCFKGGRGNVLLQQISSKIPLTHLEKSTWNIFLLSIEHLAIKNT